MNRHMKQLRVFALIAAIGLFFSACGGADDSDPTATATDQTEAAAGDDGTTMDVEPMELTYTTAFAEGGLNTGMEYWAQEIENRTDGAITVEIHYQGSLVGGLETLAAIENATVEIGAIPPAYNPGELPLANLVSVPFQTQDPIAQSRALYELTQEDTALREEYASQNTHVLMVQPAADGAVGTREPMSGPDDLDGLRLRSIGFVAEALRQLGVEPVAIGPGELYESIQRGVVDGYGGFVFDTIHTLGLHEVAPNTYDIGIGQYSGMVIGVNLEWWDSLSPEVQAMMTEVSEDFMSEQATDALMSFEQAACAAVLEEGGTVEVWSDAQKEQVTETVGDAAVQAWLESVEDQDAAQQLRDEFLSRVREYEGQSNYQSGMELCAEQSQ